MRHSLSLVLSFLIISFLPVKGSPVQYNTDILPILSGNCFECHGPDANTRKADLRLDQGHVESILSPRHPEQSKLFQRITTADPDEVMPPPDSKKSLSDEEIAMIRQWIEEGAEYQKHWAFQGPVQPEIPQIEGDEWSVNNIDRFILNELIQNRMQPEEEADPYTLLRRVTLDLTGLPPTLEEIDHFVHDSSPNAYEKVVDRLLGSERFGERMALAWMDAARYGDSSVYHADGVRDMWPWRDWVIQAFNSNKPFDEFTVEQLAGDLLPGATIPQKVASGFNRNHGTTDEGGAIAEEYRVEYIVDRVKTTSMVWLGMTLECAQCHDHKYDPLSQKEYFQFYAYFNRSSDTGLQTRNGNAPPLVYLYTPEQEKRIGELNRGLVNLKERRRVEKAPQDLVASWLSEQRTKPVPAPPASTPWQLIFPFQGGNANQVFDKTFAPETELDFKKTEDGLEWIEKPEFDDGRVHALALPDNSAAYLYRTLTVDKPGLYTLSLGSDDAIKVWLNGKGVHENNTRRGALADQDNVDVEFNQGENTLLIKIVNAAGSSGFYFKIKDSNLPTNIVNLLKIPAEVIRDDEMEKLVAYYNEKIWPEGLQIDGQIVSKQAELNTIRDATTSSMIMGDMENPRKTFVLSRGHYAAPIEDEEIFPGTPGILPPLPSDAPPNRLGLARWMVDPNHPLTARVTVNRFWQMLFGTGIVSTPEDFGVRGDRPSHPELLDWLSRDFVDHGWNVKRTIKQMVMSAAYRQSDRISPEKLEKDPQNRLLSRGPRFRLQGEFIRDQALAVSGLLHGVVGGESTKPYQPPNIWNEVSLDGNLRYDQDKGAELYRRSMYIYWKRSAPSPSMMAFDATTREQCIVRRQRTNTPLQALVTLNDVQFVEAAREFAMRVLSEGGTTMEERLNYACLLATGRPIDSTRLAALTELFLSQREGFENRPQDAEALIQFGEYKSHSDVDLPEQAAWTLVASVLLNLDEVLTR